MASKPTPDAYKSEYQKERKRVRDYIARYKRKGYIFEDNILPKIPKKITKKSIQELKALTPKKILSQAYTIGEEGELLEAKITRERTPKQIIATARNFAKLEAKRRQEKLHQKNEKEGFRDTFRSKKGSKKIYTGQSLYESYKKIKKKYGNEIAQDFVDSLSPYELDALNDTYRREQYFERIEKRHKRETGETVLQNEGDESSEESEDDYEGEFYDKETETFEADRRAKREKTDEIVRKWREEYEKQKKKKKSEREFIYEGNAIYAGILSRTEQFESNVEGSEQFEERHEMNKKWEVNFKKMINNEIQTEGFDTVMKRLNGYGIAIEDALETLYYDSNEQRVSLAFMRLVEIIQGRAMSMQEAQEYEEYIERVNYDEADEDMEDFPIDYEE